MEKQAIDIVLEKMCQMVGADKSTINFRSDQWYNEYQWTKHQENEFVKWLTEYLYKNKQARSEIMRFPSRNKKKCKAVAEMFNFIYGWKTYESETKRD